MAGAAYYNEIDPYAADWLRNLIAAGHIAPGDVDERSIEDVHPDDLRPYTQCHFFAGIGVWSYALRRAGWADDRPVWTGSCPCQPFSAAGKGTAFDDERHLWPAWHWLIQERRPPAVFGEQVASKDAESWLDLVSSDLEALGFAVGAVAFPSASVGAPHIRDRTYFVAHSAGTGPQRGQFGGQRLDAQCAAAERGGRPSGLAHPHLIAGGQGRAVDGRRHPGSDARARAGSGGDGLPVVLGNASGERCGEARGVGPGHPQRSADAGTDGGLGNAHGQRARRDGGSVRGQVYRQDGQHISHDADAPSGAGGVAHAVLQQRPGGQSGIGDEHDQAGRDEGAAALAGLCGDLRAGPVNGFWRDVDWVFCRDGKWRSVEPGTFPLAHGAPARVGRLRAYGNAINAQQAQIFIEESMRCI